MNWNSTKLAKISKYLLGYLRIVWEFHNYEYVGVILGDIIQQVIAGKARLISTAFIPL